MFPIRLQSATLILAAHFTDTHPADYPPFGAEKSMPAVLPREWTDFGTLDVTIELAKELAVFRPEFTLKYGNQVLRAHRNVVEGDHIVLTFTPDGQMGYRFGSAETQ